MLDAAFTHAKSIGVQSCVGTETPLSKPLPPLPPAPVCWATTTPKCYQDAVSRIMKHTVTINNPLNSLEWCAGQCKAAGYSIAGVEYGAACLCDDKMPPAAKALPAGSGRMPCSGNHTEECGASYIVNVYEFACAPPSGPPAPPPTIHNYTTQDYYEVRACTPSLSSTHPLSANMSV